MLPDSIFIVEDEVITQRYLQNIFLQDKIKNLYCFDNAKDVLESLKKITPEMILMDINIKGVIDGIQLAQEILYYYDIPIVFITAHNDIDTMEEIKEVTSLGFITKPFSSKEVILATKIAYKKYLKYKEEEKNIEKQEDEVVISSAITYIFSLKHLVVDNKIITLTKNQIKLLELLITSKNRVVSYEVLIVGVWGERKVADSSLRTLIYSLRKLIPTLPLILESKIGYLLQIEKSTLFSL